MTSLNKSIYKVENLVIGITILVGVISTLSYFFSRHSFWEDELIALTHGLQPFPEFFVQILRNDIHPFFYFLVLKVWALPFPESDQWILASSLVMAFASLIVIAYVTRENFGTRAAIWAAAIFIILPNFSWAAGNLRMYSLVPGLIVLAWHFNRVYFHTGDRTYLFVAFILQALLIYTHIIEFYFVAFMLAATLASHLNSASRPLIRNWFIAQTFTTLITLPVLASAVIRGSEPLPTPDLMSILIIPAQLISGWKLSFDPLALSAGGAVFLVLSFFALWHADSRRTALVLVFGALFTSMLISLLGKPMFKSPVFTANLIPFLVIFGATGIARSRETWSHRIPAILLVTSLAFSSLPWTKALLPPENYQPAAEYLKQNMRAGDVVVIPNVSVYWGILRYGVSPDWGYPLSVANLTDNPAWTNLKKKLGTDTTRTLGLIPKTDAVSANGLTFLISNTPGLYLSNRNRVWVVFRKNYKESIELGHPFSIHSSHWLGNELVVYESRKSAIGINSISNK